MNNCSILREHRVHRWRMLTSFAEVTKSRNQYLLCLLSLSLAFSLSKPAVLLKKSSTDLKQFQKESLGFEIGLVFSTCHSFYFFHRRHRIDFSDSAKNSGTVPRSSEVVEAGEDIEAGSENNGEDVLPKIGDIQSNPVNPCIFLQIYRDTTKKRL